MAHIRITLESQDALRGQLRAWRRRLAMREAARWVMRLAFFIVMGLLVYSVRASAQNAPRSYQSLESIRARAEAFVRDAASGTNDQTQKTKLFVKAGDPDARLQLADCGENLKAFALNGATIGARNTIGVRCADESQGSWTIYLPVLVEVEKPVLVLKHSLVREAHIAAGDVDVQLRRVPGIGSNYPSDVASLRDQHLKRGITMGATLTSDYLARDLLVKRGQEVLLAVDVGGIVIRAPGLALGDGGLADRVRVQNRTSLKIVEGIVESGNLVRVGM